MSISNKDFVHLHVHTHISVQDALASPAEYAKFARQQGFTSAAITDHGRMGGIVEFVIACREPIEGLPQIKPILGQEFYTCEDMTTKEQVTRQDGTRGRPKHPHLTLIAMNKKGYSNLLKASSLGAVKGYYYEPRIDWSVIKEYSEGVICLSGCMGSELCQALIRGDKDGAEKIAIKFKEVFGDRYYIELQYHRIEQQKKILPELKALAKKLDIKCVASNDVHYLKSEDWNIHDALLQMRDIRNKDKDGDKNNKLGKREAYQTHEFYLKSAEEMRIVFDKFCPEAIKNSVEIADRIEDFLKLDVPHLLPKSQINEDDKFIAWWNKVLPYNEKNEAYLAYLAFKGLCKLGFNKSQEYIDRLKYELKIIWYMGVVDYFLIQHEVITYMKESDILFGIRGSGVGSLVNYCLGISSVDPIKWDLMFERFLNPGRGTQFLINYSCSSSKEWMLENEKRDQDDSLLRLQAVIDESKENDEYKQFIPVMEKELWILENQGLAAYICDLVDRGCKNEKNESQLWLAFLMGITEEKPTSGLVVSKIATLPDIDTDIDDSRRQEVIDWVRQRFGEEHMALIGTRGTYKVKASVTNCLKISERFRDRWGDQVAQKAIEISKTIPSTSESIEEAIKESKAGFAHYAKEYDEEMAIAEKIYGRISHTGIHAAGVIISSRPIDESSPLEQSKGQIVSGFDMDSVVKVGLVKYDYLGSAIYQMLFRVIKLVKKRHGIDIRLQDIDFEDPNIFSLYLNDKAGTLFQCTGQGMQDSIKGVSASSLEDLIAMIAMFRPGPVQFIPDYIKGKNHPESISYPHEDLKAELSKTFGIMVYQEQAMFLARKMGNLSWLEVDKLRGAISKKKPKEFEASCNLLRERALKRGYDNKVIDYTLKLMEKFGGYAFNRSHSCVYSILSYWGGFFRYYYPAEWLASCMQVDHAKEDSMVMYKKECRNEKIKVINPNVNDSGLDTTVTEDGAIALPLTTIKGVGNDVSKTIVLHQPFDSMWDFVIRARPNRGMVESLADSGALDCFVEVRKMHDTIEIMDYYDKLVEERNNADKKAAKEARMKYKVLSPMNIGASSKTQNNSIFKRNLPKDLFGE